MPSKAQNGPPHIGESRGLLGIIARSSVHHVPFRASASMVMSLSDGGLKRPGLTGGGSCAARIASFSAGSTRR